MADDELEAAYKNYCTFCQNNGSTPDPYPVFVANLVDFKHKLAALSIADKITEPSDAHYLAIRVTGTPNPGVGAITKSCAQCRQEVWIDLRFLKYAKASKGILCNVCAPEILGKPLRQLIAEQIARKP